MKIATEYASNEAAALARRIIFAREEQVDYKAAIIHVAAMMVENAVDGDSLDPSQDRDYLVRETLGYLDIHLEELGISKYAAHRIEPEIVGRLYDMCLAWYTTDTDESLNMLEAACRPGNYARRNRERLDETMAEVLEDSSELEQESDERRFVARLRDGHKTQIITLAESDIKLFWVRGESAAFASYEGALELAGDEGEIYADLDRNSYPDILGVEGEFDYARENAEAIIEKFHGDYDEWGKLWGVFLAGFQVPELDNLIDCGKIGERIDELKAAMLEDKLSSNSDQ